MSLFGLMEKRSATLANPDKFLLGFFGGRPTESGSMVSEQNALSLTTVWACVNVVAEALAKLPLNLYRHLSNGDHELVTDLPVAALVAAAPNDEMSTAAWKSTTMGWVLTWGNGYAEIERNGAGLPIALHPLAPNRIIPRRRQRNPVTGRDEWRIEYYVTRTALQSPYLLEQQTLTGDPIDRDDMLHFAGLGFDGIVGYSPVAMAREAIGLGLSAQAYGARFFGNSGVPSGILKSAKTVKDPKKLREQWDLVHSGPGQRRTAVLEDGVEYQQIGIPPEDSQFLQTRLFQRTEICGIYRVPPHKVGELTRSTNNNIEHQEMEFVNDCLMGWLVRFEQECGRKLLTLEQLRAGYFFSFDVDQILRGDMGARYAAYATGRQWGYLSADDVRRREKMNALPKGQGAIYLVPMNMVPADQVAKSPPVLAPAPVVASPANAPALPAGADVPAGDEDAPAEADTETDGSADGGGRKIAPDKLRATFRALLIDAATRAVRKETAALRRAAGKPATFAAAAREFYAGHGDHLRALLLPVASGLGDLAGIPFVTARGAVEKLAHELPARSLTELADPKLNVEALLGRWDRQRPEEMADTLLASFRFNENHDDMGRFADSDGGGGGGGDKSRPVEDLVKVSAGGQIALKHPANAKEAGAMVEKVIALHDHAVQKHQEAQALPSNHPDKVKAALHLNHVQNQLTRVVALAKPFAKGTSN